MIFFSIIPIIILFGVIKTSSLIIPELDTVKIASIILLPEEGKAVDPEGLFSKRPSPFEETLSKIETLTTKAVLNNVKIVTFQETSTKIREENETNLMD